MNLKQKYEKYKPKKFLGQNFLVDENIAGKIVASLDPQADDVIIEIGPGRGALTKIISRYTKRLIAVELDKKIYEQLLTEYDEKIKLIHKDFLNIDFKKDITTNYKKLKIIGNIPYNITTEILFKLYETSEQISTAVLMVQKEVAHRLVSKPNSKDYGILAVQTQFYTDPKILFNVPPSAFFPKPRVNSSIVRFDFNKDKTDLKDVKLFKTLVRESFGQRRKTMKNSLKKFFEEKNIFIDEIDFDFSRRPENVSVREFVNLSNKIYPKTV